MGDLTAHWRASYDNKYLGAWNLFSEKRRAYFEVTVTISRVTQEEVIGEMGRKSWPILLYLQGPKSALPAPMIVSKTSGKTLEILFGESPKSWEGQTITLYVRKDKKVRKGTGAVLVIRNTKGSRDMVEEMQEARRAPVVDEGEFEGHGEAVAREPGEEG